MRGLMALCAGVLFGLGLLLSGMVNPAKVLFLQLRQAVTIQHWDRWVLRSKSYPLQVMAGGLMPFAVTVR